MRRQITLISFSLCFAALFAAGAEMRTWTDTTGRRIEAALRDVSGDMFTMERSDAQRFSIPSSVFSAADRAYIRAWAANHNATPDAAAPLKWPDRVEADSPRTEIVVERDGSHIYRTDHFEFRSETRLSRTLVAQFGQLFEATFSAVQEGGTNFSWLAAPRRMSRMQ